MKFGKYFVHVKPYIGIIIAYFIIHVYTNF